MRKKAMFTKEVIKFLISLLTRKIKYGSLFLVKSNKDLKGVTL
jgi:hypothetical protein